VKVASRRFRTRAVAWIPALMVLLASCAPHVSVAPMPTPQARLDRYRAALAQREARGAAVDAEIVLWAEGVSAVRLPGASARLLLAAPDAFRVRVGSMFGTALDLGARGDSLDAYVPARRLGLRVDAVRDSLGLARPGSLGFRALSATWRPPDAAWSLPPGEDSTVVLRWVEAADTLSVAVGADGLPVWASFARPGANTIRATYRAWDRSAGVAWPAWIEFTDETGDLRITCKLSRVTFPALMERGRMAVPMPGDVEQLTLAQLRRALERLGGVF
jgi:hypothetical protein